MILQLNIKSNYQYNCIRKDVDAVIVDGHVNPDHPEFAVNVDGTGGSRVNQFNWFQYKSAFRI